MQSGRANPSWCDSMLWTVPLYCLGIQSHSPYTLSPAHAPKAHVQFSPESSCLPKLVCMLSLGGLWVFEPASCSLRLPSMNDSQRYVYAWRVTLKFAMKSLCVSCHCSEKPATRLRRRPGVTWEAHGVGLKEMSLTRQRDHQHQGFCSTKYKVWPKRHCEKATWGAWP